MSFDSILRVPFAPASLAFALLALSPLLPAPGADGPLPCRACAAAGAGELRAQTLEERVETALASTPATGAVVAVVHADSLLLLQAFGYADDSRVEPMTVGRIAPLGRIGEALLGAAAVRLAEAGALELEAPLSALMPGLPPGLGGATLAQLLTSTAGLDDSPLLPYLPGEEPEALPPEREVELLSDRVLFAPPGVIHSSSRYSALLAGHVLESVAGRPLPDVLSSLVLEPAGMEWTVFSTAEAMALGGRSGYVRSRSPERPFEDAVLPTDSLLAPHLRVWSPVPDLAALLAGWLGSLPGPGGDAEAGGDANPHRGANPERDALAGALRLSSLALVTDPATPSGGVAHGFGWQTTELDGFREVRASGGGAGHSVLLRVLPEARLGVVILTNGAGASLHGLAGFLLERLQPAVAPEAERVPVRGITDTALLTAEITPPLQPIDELGPEQVGTYRNGSEILMLVETPDGVRAEVGSAQPLEIRPQEQGVHTVHIADGRQTMRIRILRDEEGGTYLLLGGRVFVLQAG